MVQGDLDIVQAQLIFFELEKHRRPVGQNEAEGPGLVLLVDPQQSAVVSLQGLLELAGNEQLVPFLLQSVGFFRTLAILHH